MLWKLLEKMLRFMALCTCVSWRPLRGKAGEGQRCACCHVMAVFWIHTCSHRSQKKVSTFSLSSHRKMMPVQAPIAGPAPLPPHLETWGGWLLLESSLPLDYPFTAQWLLRGLGGAVGLLSEAKNASGILPLPTSCQTRFSPSWGGLLSPSEQSR